VQALAGCLLLFAAYCTVMICLAVAGVHAPWWAQ
jgi:hypothetical protein